jgi:hypothetical protein
MNSKAFLVIVAILGASPMAMAQTQSAPTPKPAATAPAKPAMASPMDKSAKAAKSKECSAQADQKGLHGKARKKFREECKNM